MASERYQISPFLSWREVDGQTVAVDAQEGKVYQFNEVAAAIWKSMENAKTAEEIAACVAREYDGSPAKIQKDVNSFLKQLFQDDLITKENA